MSSDNSLKDIVIFGAGGLGREIYDTILSINNIDLKLNVIGFIDEVKSPGELVNGIQVLGGEQFLSNLHSNVGIVLGMASSESRRRIFNQYKAYFEFPRVLHPSATISSFAKLGEGVLIQAGCVVAANATLGDCVMMNAHSGVGHDARIGSWCSIMSFCDVAGNSELGESCFVGTGAKVIPSITIASESFICAGSVVLKSISQKSKLIGNPAKVIG